MANRQVRLTPDVCDWMEVLAYEWDCSLTSATVRVLRMVQEDGVRDDDDDGSYGDDDVDIEIEYRTSSPAPGEPTTQTMRLRPNRRDPRGTTARLATILERNRQRG